jgi:predicted nucleic acid-binding protein
MKGFLLDTNVPSEMTRPRPQSSVSEWLDNADDDRLYFSVVSLGEILKGITILPESKRRSGLQQWLDETLRPWFEGRVLPISESIAEQWGVLAGQCQLRGRPLGLGWFHCGNCTGTRSNHHHAKRKGF